MPYLEDSTPDPTHARRPDFSRVRTQGSLVVDVASVVERVAARLKGEAEPNRDMLLLTARASSEIVNTVGANTEVLKRLEG